MIGPKVTTFSWLPALLAILLVLPACLPRADASPSAVGAPQAAPYSSQAQVMAQSTGISVQGQGSASSAPDQAELILGVSIKATGLAQAQSDASARMGRVMDRLASMGIAKDQIKTVRFNIYPQYAQDQTLTGYQVDNIISAKTRAMDKVGDLLDAAVAAGANRVERIGFSVADPRPLAVKARDEAMADAKAKAEQLAKLAGVRLGRPTQITESGGAPPPAVQMAVPRAAEAYAQTTPISPGETEIRVNVQVTYSIE